MKTAIAWLLVALGAPVMVGPAMGPDEEDAHGCTEVQYGPGRKGAGGTYSLDVTVFNRCKTTVFTRADVGIEGRGWDSKPCRDTLQNVMACTVPFNEREKSCSFVVSGRCQFVDRAWITRIEVAKRKSR